MKSNIKTSIITPVYNNTSLINRCVNSVFIQNCDNYEHIIVDDCSTDKTKLNLSKLEKKYPNLKIIYNQENVGPASSRNKALEIAEGELIAFLDSDDEWSPGKMKQQKAIALKQRHPVISSGYYKVRNQKVVKTKVFSKKVVCFSDLLYTNYIYTSTAVVDRRITGDFKMNTKFYYDDFILWLDLLQSYGSAFIIQQPLVRYNISPGSVSRNKLKSSYEVYKIYKNYLTIPLFSRMYYFTWYAINGLFK